MQYQESGLAGPSKMLGLWTSRNVSDTYDLHAAYVYPTPLTRFVLTIRVVTTYHCDHQIALL